MADVVEDALAADGEVAHARSPGHAGAGDQAVQAGEVELERLELELRGGRLELAGADDELGDQAGERLVAGGRSAAGVRTRPRRYSAARRVIGRGEELVEVGLGEAALALLGEREAVGEEGALGLLAAVQGRSAPSRRWLPSSGPGSS